MALGHSSASASARPSGISSLPPRACSLSPPTRRSDIRLAQMNTPKPSAVCRTLCVFISWLLMKWLLDRAFCIGLNSESGLYDR